MGIVYDLTTKLDDTLAKFMQVSISNQKSINASFKNLETKMGKLVKHVADLMEQTKIGFLANTKTNPKGYCSAIFTRSGGEYDTGSEGEEELVIEGVGLNKVREMSAKEEKLKAKPPIVVDLPYSKNPTKRDNVEVKPTHMTL